MAGSALGKWAEGDHPRDERGRFAAGSGLATWVARQTSDKGGLTYKPTGALKDRVPKDGIMVSRDTKEGLGHVVEIRKMAEREPPPTAKEFKDEIRKSVGKWLDKALVEVKKLGPDHYLGGWAEKDSKGGVLALHFDVSQRFETRHKEDAIKAGRERNQLAVWHIEKGEEINTGGTGR